MAAPACPRCGRPIRSAKGCGCEGGAALAETTTWQLPALAAAVERRIRIFALPVALLMAWGLVHTGLPRMLLRTVLSMWIHELGHAVAAWLCGRFALPGPWFTPVGLGRSLIVVGVLAAALVLGAWKLWRTYRPWSVALLLLLLEALRFHFTLSAFVGRDPGALLLLLPRPLGLLLPLPALLILRLQLLQQGGELLVRGLLSLVAALRSPGKAGRSTRKAGGEP